MIVQIVVWLANQSRTERLMPRVDRMIYVGLVQTCVENAVGEEVTKAHQWIPCNGNHIYSHEEYCFHHLHGQLTFWSVHWTILSHDTLFQTIWHQRSNYQSWAHTLKLIVTFAFLGGLLSMFLGPCQCIACDGAVWIYFPRMCSKTNGKDVSCEITGTRHCMLHTAYCKWTCTMPYPIQIPTDFQREGKESKQMHSPHTSCTNYFLHHNKPPWISTRISQFSVVPMSYINLQSFIDLI